MQNFVKIFFPEAVAGVSGPVIGRPIRNPPEGLPHHEAVIQIRADISGAPGEMKQEAEEGLC